MTQPPPRHPSPALELALLRGAIDELPFGVATTRDGAVSHANRALEHIFGAAPGQLDGSPLEAVFSSTELARIRSALDFGHPYDARAELTSLDGRVVTVELHAQRYRSADERAGFFVARDVTPEASALGRVLVHLGGALFRIKLPDVVESVSPVIEGIVGIDANTLRSSPQLLLERVRPTDREHLSSLAARLASGELRDAAAEVRVERAPGDEVPVELFVSGRVDLTGRVRYLEGVAVDASARHAARRTAASLDAARSLVEDARARAVVPQGSRGGVTSESLRPASRTLGRELLAEAAFHLGSVSAQAAAMRVAVGAGAGIASDVSTELGRAFAAIAENAASAARIARRVLALGDSVKALLPVGELVEELSDVLGPLVAQRLTIGAVEGSARFVSVHADRVLAALAVLGIYTWRAGGAGALRLSTNVLTSAAGEEVVLTFVAERDEPRSAFGDVTTTAPLLPPEHSRAELQVLEAVDATLREDGGRREADGWAPTWARGAARLLLAEA